MTGPSGAGRSTAVNVLEDFGYETIDNMPLSLLPRLVDGPPLDRPLVLGVDVRNRDFDPQALLETVGEMGRKADHDVVLLYLDCRPDILLRRYSETRRRHPMAPAETPETGIGRELDLLAPVRSGADILLDTSDLTPRDLGAELGRWFALVRGKNPLAVSVHSFSYKRGLPRSLDMVFDCRFLRNPYWNPDLRALDGRDAAVADYIAEDPKFTIFFHQLRTMAEFLLPAYVEEGKSHLAIGLGCTGGQHRSVAISARLASELAQQGWQVSTRHHELERRGQIAAPARSGSVA